MQLPVFKEQDSELPVPSTSAQTQSARTEKQDFGMGSEPRELLRMDREIRKSISRVLPSRLCSAEGTVFSLTHGPGEGQAWNLWPHAYREQQVHRPQNLLLKCRFQDKSLNRKSRYQTVQGDQNYYFHILQMPPPLFNDSKLKRDTYELEDPKVNPEKEEKGAVRTQTPERQRWSLGCLRPLPVSLQEALLLKTQAWEGAGAGRGVACWLFQGLSHLHCGQQRVSLLLMPHKLISSRKRAFPTFSIHLLSLLLEARAARHSVRGSALRLTV